MTKSVMMSLLRQGETGDDILQILDTLTAGFEYIESPMIEQSLGIPTSEPIEF